MVCMHMYYSVLNHLMIQQPPKAKVVNDLGANGHGTYHVAITQHELNCCSTVVRLVAAMYAGVTEQCTSCSCNLCDTISLSALFALSASKDEIREWPTCEPRHYQHAAQAAADPSGLCQDAFSAPQTWS